MCAIMGYLGKELKLEKFREYFEKTVSRGCAISDEPKEVGHPTK